MKQAGYNPRSPDGVVLHFALAEMLLGEGNVDEAEAALSAPYEFVHQKTIPNGYFVGMSDSVKGACLAAQRKPDEAESLLIAGLENLRQSRGDHHRLTRDARDRLVAFYRQTGRDEQADQYVKLLGPGFPSSK